MLQNQNGSLGTFVRSTYVQSVKNPFNMFYMDLNSEFALELYFNRHSLIMIFSKTTWARTSREDQGRQGLIIAEQRGYSFISER